MARNESDREDLIREATALRNRIEWQLPCESDPVFAGVRADGSLSVYFGQDPVYQFTPYGQLRRAYAAGFLYRTQGKTLAKLHRERSPNETVLARSDLNPDELSRFLIEMDERLTRLGQSIANGSAKLLRQISEGAPADYQSLIDLALHTSPRLAPAIPTRRQ
ncbi:MAG: hypothetical protein O2983_17700 [Planctomycetota bacterium]|nr:hypothetical protein [Planctomycetota bacterium]MDA0919381.1 hypothetical protein [Planctomycetota bacterium]MDA1161442.1 hypothetical protein [Planctomycetota bacterium]